jgi:K(+)-stimulated pyrophosphate-energized sodium pump
MDYTEKPDSGAVIDICTAASLRELATPALLAVLTPVIIGFGINYLALGAFLAAVILTGQLMANFLSNAGGAWDNAKKYIEDGHEGGKGSDAHKAAVIGDTVGDPFKDTAGPALNPLIKVMNLVSLLILPAVISLRHNDGARYAIAGVALVVLGLAIAFSKRKTSAMDAPLVGEEAALADPAGSGGRFLTPGAGAGSGVGAGAGAVPAAGGAGINGGRDEVLVAAIDQWIYDPVHGDLEVRTRLLEVKARLGPTP